MFTHYTLLPVALVIKVSQSSVVDRSDFSGRAGEKFEKHLANVIEVGWAKCKAAILSFVMMWSKNHTPVAEVI